jgi:hypothetical protein
LTTPVVTNAGTLALSATGANIVTASTNGVERLRISSGGAVAIGSTGEGQSLIVTDVRNTGNIDLGNVGLGKGTLHIENTNSTQGQDNIATGISFGGVTSGRRRAFIGTFNDSATDAAPTGLIFATKSGAFATTDGVTERMRIDSAGKILAAAGTNWVGTVSQNGQSSVIERGSNANGEFVRYADGTQICWVVPTADPLSVTFSTRTESGFTARFAPLEWTFPAAFSSIPSVSASFRGLIEDSTVSIVVFNSVSVNSVSQSSAQLRLWAPSTAVFSANFVSRIATGRWF